AGGQLGHQSSCMNRHPASTAYSPVHYPGVASAYVQPELTSNPVVGQGLGFDYGPVSSSAGYPFSSAGYLVSSAGYTIAVSSSAGYPISSAYNLSTLWPIATSQPQPPISSAAASVAVSAALYYSGIVASSAAPPPMSAPAMHSQFVRQQQQQQQHLIPASSVYRSLPLSSNSSVIVSSNTSSHANNNYPRLSYAMAGPATTQQYQVSYTANNPRMYAAFPPPTSQGFRQAAIRTEEDDSMPNGGGPVGKPKTPMAQLNDIAKHNRVSAQYILVDEQGPAHKKTFFIKLRLGTEEYQASGLSIKKAQHSAAERALEATGYARPTLRDLRELAKRRRELRALGPPPTHELDALARRLGETVRYESLVAAASDHPAAAGLVSVRLTVGDRQFTADGPSLHFARQNAAVNALRLLKQLSSSESASKAEEQQQQHQCQKPLATVANGNNSDAECDGVGGHADEDVDNNSERPPANKSDVSLLYEVANKRRWQVEFYLETENGPAHMKTFRYTCRVDDLVCQAEGKSKMTAKKTCATKMLELVRDKLGEEAYNQTVAMKSKSYYAKAFDSKKKTKNVIKEQKADPQYGNQVNPISRLIQITQARKQKDPVYSLSLDRPTIGYSRHREYHIDCVLPSTGERTQGVGPNKKLAKRVAAEAMLELMGYRRIEPAVPRKSALKSGLARAAHQSQSASPAADSANAASDSAAVAAASAAVAAAAAATSQTPSKKVIIASARGTLGGESLPPLPDHTDLPIETLGLIAHELLTEGQSLTAETINPGAACLRGRHRPKAQLLYLCEAAGCSVEFADSARQQEHGRTVYSSRVLVGVQGRLPDLCAESDSVERAHDAAASLALEKLAELSLNSTMQQPQVAAANELNECGPASVPAV
ncbi:hypothetical protein BOX15_Mlig002159g5, partial [Macrostomum lignano]